jgi:hypothetical protein
MRTAQYDLVIRGGEIYDGDGGAGLRGDIAVHDGTIVEVGAVSRIGAEEVDASGKIVTPGFVDIHTHIDGQAVWDESLGDALPGPNARGERGKSELPQPDPDVTARGSGITMVTNGERGRAMGRVSQTLPVAHLDVHCAPSLDIHAEPWIQTYFLGRPFRLSVRTPRWKSADSHSTAHLSGGLRAQYADIAVERDAAARLIKEAIRS